MKLKSLEKATVRPYETVRVRDLLIGDVIEIVLVGSARERRDFRVVERESYTVAALRSAAGSTKRSFRLESLETEYHYEEEMELDAEVRRRRS